MVGGVMTPPYEGRWGNVAEVMTLEERMAWLSGLIRDDSVDKGTKLKAADLLNKMDGGYQQKEEKPEEMTIRVRLTEEP